MQAEEGEKQAASRILPPPPPSAPPFLDGCQIYGGWFDICGACLPLLIVEEAERFRLLTLLVRADATGRLVLPASDPYL